MHWLFVITWPLLASTLVVHHHHSKANVSETAQPIRPKSPKMQVGSRSFRESCPRELLRFGCAAADSENAVGHLPFTYSPAHVPTVLPVSWTGPTFRWGTGWLAPPPWRRASWKSPSWWWPRKTWHRRISISMTEMKRNSCWFERSAPTPQTDSSS